jgi:hypothetical protein
LVLTLALSFEDPSTWLPFKLSMALSNLVSSLKFYSRVVLLAFLTNISIEMGRVEVYNSMETSSKSLESCGIH